MTDITVYETAQLFGLTETGTTPDLADDAQLAALGREIARLVAAGLAESGLTELAVPLGARVIDTLHREATRLQRDHDAAADRLAPMIREQDGSEIASVQLEDAMAATQRLEALTRAVETIRDSAAESYTNDTGTAWLPRAGRGSRTGQGVTASTIDAAEMRAAAHKARADALDPIGRRVLVTGSKRVADIDWVYDRLDRTRDRIGAMVLVTRGGETGTDRIAAAWAASRGVAHLTEVPNWTKDGKAAPFKANDRMLAMKPAAVVVFGGEGEGIPCNLAEKAEARQIATWRVAAARPQPPAAA